MAVWVETILRELLGDAAYCNIDGNHRKQTDRNLRCGEADWVRVKVKVRVRVGSRPAITDGMSDL